MTDKPRLYKGIVIREEKNRYLVFDPRKDIIFETNSVGGHILRLLNGQNSIEEIISQIAKTYSQKTQLVASDIKEFLNKLNELNLIQ